MLIGLLLASIIIVAPTLVVAYWKTTLDNGGNEPPDQPGPDTVFVDSSILEEIIIISDGPSPPSVMDQARPSDPLTNEIRGYKPVADSLGTDIPIDTRRDISTTPGGDTGDAGIYDDWLGRSGGTVFIQDTATYSLSDIVEQPPEMIFMPDPEYPPLARRAGIEGSVMLHVLVDVDGTVRQVRVHAESVTGFRFGDYAAQAARQAVFRPAIQGHQPVRCWVSFGVRFQLE
jgi:protein TonB